MAIANPRNETPGENAVLSPDMGLLVFVKAPQPGACKTRLAAGLGAQRATRLYAAMAERAVAHAAAAAPGRVRLVCTPDTQHFFFMRLARRYGVRCQRQGSGDLGTRMRRAIDRALAEHDRVVLMGSDQPALHGAPLHHADTHLGFDCPVWLAPTCDGGYWAIGLARPLPLFRGPCWSTATVAAHTRTIVRRLGLRWSEYSLRRDIDDTRDWQRLDGRLKSRLAAQATRSAARFNGRAQA